VRLDRLVSDVREAWKLVYTHKYKLVYTHKYTWKMVYTHKYMYKYSYIYTYKNILQGALPVRRESLVGDVREVEVVYVETRIHKQIYVQILVYVHECTNTRI